MLRFLSCCPTRAVLAGRVVAALVLALLAAPLAHAQQFVVDDAGITEPGGCQIEGWISTAAGWVLPACTPISRTEITIGVGYGDDDHGDHSHRQVEYVAQAKVMVLPDDPGRFGAAVVIGAGFGPFAQATGLPTEGFFAFVPVTWTSPGEDLMVHVNGGWSYDRTDQVHRGIFGLRTDFALMDRLAAVGEIFAEGEDLGFQLGLTFEAIPNRLAFDASFGDVIAGDTPAIGVAFGIAWTVPPFFTPIL